MPLHDGAARHTVDLDGPSARARRDDPGEAPRRARQAARRPGDRRRGRRGRRAREAAVQPRHGRGVRRRTRPVEDDPRRPEEAAPPDDHDAEGRRPRGHRQDQHERRRPAARVRAPQGRALQVPPSTPTSRDRAALLAARRRGAPGGGREDRRGAREDRGRDVLRGRRQGDIRRATPETAAAISARSSRGRAAARARRGGLRRSAPGVPGADPSAGLRFTSSGWTSARPPATSPSPKCAGICRSACARTSTTSTSTTTSQKLRHEAFVKIYDPALAKAEEEEKKAS